MQSWGPCEELPADLWLHEDHWWSSCASPQVDNDDNWSISACLGKYSTKQCEVAASMSSLVFLGCSKQSHRHTRMWWKRRIVEAFFQPILCIFCSSNCEALAEPIQQLHLFLFLWTPPTRGPLHHARARFTLHQGASASFPSSKMAWSNWKNSPQGAMPMVLLDPVIFVDVRLTEPTS